jgi:aminomethyltransferase
MKKTPFHEINLEYGAEMREMFGYYLPWEYATGAVEEHLGTRSRASLCDLDYMGEFSIKGPDALRYVQRLLTNDCSQQRVGQIKYTTMCDALGHMVDDGTIWRRGESEFMLVTGDEGDFGWLQQNAVDFDVRVENITSNWTTLALQGPQSKAITCKLTDVPLDALKYYHFTEATVHGMSCVLARMGYTGEFGYEFHFDPRHAADMWRAIMDAGSDHGIVPCGQVALESLRQEAGYLLVGNDHDKATNPLEAGIGSTVKFGKTDFKGKQALLEMVERGLDRRMVWFRLPGGEVASKGAAVWLNGKKVGEVTSGSLSPTFSAGTAMGYVQPQFAIPGLEYAIEVEGRRCSAFLSLVPPYDPLDTRTKAAAAVQPAGL